LSLPAINITLSPFFNFIYFIFASGVGHLGFWCPTPESIK
jgi:hypothetical protein